MDRGRCPPTMTSMETKKKPGVAVVSEGTAQAALRRAPAKELAPEEDKVLRMRLGAAPPRAATLEKAGAGRSDLEIELLAYEIEAHLRWKAHRAAQAVAVAPARAAITPMPSRTKEKIIRALRKKA
jgi:hypothetical protein